MNDILSRKIKGELIVGDHDSITIFGSNVQASSSECTKSITNIVMASNYEIDVLIEDALQELNSFQDKRKKPWFMGEKKHYINIVKEYNVVLRYIDKIVITLKLQQAQILKDSEILKRIDEKLDICISELETYIVHGNNVVISTNNMIATEEGTIEAGDLETWKGRLQKKIDNIAISKTISLQNKAQIHILQENNNLLMDKINTIISEIVPLWHNQINILLGMENINRNAKKYNEAMEIAQEYLESGVKDISKRSRKKKKELDIDKIETINNKLIGTLGELKLIEAKDVDIKKQITTI